MDGGVRTANVTGAEFFMNGLLFWNGTIDAPQNLLNELEKLIQCRRFADGDIKDLVQCRGIFDCGSEEVGLDDVVYETEVTAGFAIAINVNGFMLKQSGDPAGNYGRVGTIRILPGAEHVKIAQTDAVQAIDAGKNIGINFIRRLGGGVRRKQIADVFLDFWQDRMVAIDGAA